MPTQFFKTSMDAGHWHLGFINGEMSLTSEDGAKGKKHRHPMQVSPISGVLELLPWVDPKTGAEHSHLPVMEDMKPSALDREPEGDDSEKMREILDLWKIASEYEKAPREEAEKAIRYYKNDQWLDEDRAAMEETGRPALTLNLMEGTVDVLGGYARQNRIDWKWFPIEGSDSEAADLLNIVGKHLAKRTNMEVEEIEVFEEKVKIGRSFFEVIPDFSKNPLGEVRVSQFPSFSVRTTPHLKKDMSDCEALFKEQDLSTADAKSRYPKFAKQIDMIFVESAQTPKDPEDGPTLELIEAENGYGADVATTSVDPALYRDVVVDIGRKTIKHLECERREFRVAHYILVPGTLQVTEVDSDVASKAETMAPMVQTFDAPASRIRVTVTIGPYVVKDHYPVRPFNDFSLVADWGKKDAEEYWGKFRSIFDCQDEINKRHSQIMDILNKMAGYGWLYDENTFVTPADAAKFDASVSTPGYRCKIANVERPPIRQEGTKPPTEILQMETVSMQMFQAISNVNAQTMGQGKAAESNASKMTQIRQGMIGNEFLFDNFVQAKRETGRRAMAWAKMLYSPERVARIVLSNADTAAKNGEPMELWGKKLGPEMPDQERMALMEKIRRIWQKTDLLYYDVEIGEGVLSPTARQAQFNQWLEARKVGVPVPPSLLIDFSDLPNKQKYLKEMQAIQEQTQEIEKQKAEAELLKARGGAAAPGVTLQHEKQVMAQPAQPQVPQGAPQPQGQ